MASPKIKYSSYYLGRSWTIDIKQTHVNDVTKTKERAVRNKNHYTNAKFLAFV